MRLLLDMSGYVFEVSRAPEPKVDRSTGAQRQDRDSGRLLWIVQLYAKGPDGRELINVTVAGDQPKLTLDQTVSVRGLEVIPYVGQNDNKARVSYRAESITALAAAKAA